MLGKSATLAHAASTWRSTLTVHLSGVALQSRKLKAGNVAFGSKADIAARSSNVRFTPKSGHGTQSRNVCFVPQADILHCGRN